MNEILHILSEFLQTMPGQIALWALGLTGGAWLLFKSLNIVSYTFIKRQILKERTWDLNICCGKTDGGGINADIVQHGTVPNYVQVHDIYELPFRDHQFDNVLCSHTMEHVDDPERFLSELKRVGKKVKVVLPPLWDITAVINFYEHRWIFLSFKKAHVNILPKRIKLPFARTFQRNFGQNIRC